jgi:hypothetical protein
MDLLSIASKRLMVAHDGLEQHYQDCIAAQDEWESRLHERMSQLICKKEETAKANGNLDASNETSWK